MKDLIQNYGEFISLALVLVIVVFAIWGYLYIQRKEDNDELLMHRGFIEMIPSLVSTLGVLGTFAGITLGLLFFNTKELTQSIPLLLVGLKTAFFTSLTGMVGSLVISSKVNKVFDKKTSGVSDSVEAAGLVVKAVQFLNNLIEKQNLTQTNLLMVASSINEKMDNIVTNTNTMSDTISNLSLQASNIKENQQSIEGKADSLLQSVGNIEDASKDIISKAAERNTQIGKLLNHSETLLSGQSEINEHVSKFGNRLHGEVVEIEDKMTETSRLMESKFNEFSDLLKKSNTEALVEVMKSVTVEFQKQMNALINKLIQENFEELNRSVDRLNSWQQENKAMIQSLTSQYKQMAENFENTSESLSKVDEDTRQLISEGGKLHQIIGMLNKVIVEDEKFTKISSDLQKTTELTKTNFEQFDEATKALNDWVRKQRNFVDGITVLIQKLEELNELKNYSEQFWKDTKQGMTDGVNIIKNGTDTLNKQVSTLNSQFYARLSTTLTELDNCIQALVIKAERR